MKFDYFKLPLPQRSDFFGSAILKPIIPLKISKGNQTIQYAALIDSGAVLRVAALEDVVEGHA